MKSKLILIILVCLFSPQSIARKSGGLKFWQGTGGTVVLGGVLWWALSDDEDDTSKSDFDFYTKPNANSYEFANSTNYELMGQPSLFARYSFIKKNRVNSYSFIGFNTPVIKVNHNAFEIDTSDVFGLGLQYSFDKSGKVEFEIFQTVFAKEGKMPSLSVSYQQYF
jgi:hypothetical protein